MTRVLEAWDRHGHRHVALKVLVDRLAADEAFVEGPSLPDMLADRGPLPPVGAARVAASVCAALAAAHASGVVHGHLTPANILLAVDGRVKR